MILNFAEALNALGQNTAATIANEARPTGSFLFNTFLPERTQPSYYVDASNMIVRSTMAGLVGMDSPYPPAGSVEISSFLENSAKLGIESTLTEGALRHLQDIMLRMQATGTMTNDYLQREALNFLQKIIIQGQLDRAEWLRAQAIVYGLINWTFNGKTLSIDYGIPATNKLTTRTNANNDAYNDTGSLFWTDVLAARTRLGGQIRAVVLNSATLDQIVRNSVNSVVQTSQTESAVSIRQWVNRGGNTILNEDVRYQVNFVVYDGEVEVLATSAAVLGSFTAKQTQTVKLVPDGKVVFVGASAQRGYRVGEGSTPDPRNDMELGFHAICPTVEGGGNPGRWARLYVPEGRPMHLRGQGASNELPVITSPEKIVIATTEMM